MYQILWIYPAYGISLAVRKLGKGVDNLFEGLFDNLGQKRGQNARVARNMIKRVN